MRYGPFEGSTLEQIVFKPKGIGYLEWIKKRMEEGKYRHPLPRYNYLRKTLERADKLHRIIQKKCRICQKNKAEWISVRGRQKDGFLISPEFIYCDLCYRQERKFADNKTYFLKALPRECMFFRRVHDQEVFLKTLRNLYDFPPRVRAEELQFIFQSMDGYSVEQGQLFSFDLSATDLIYIYRQLKKKKFKQ